MPAALTRRFFAVLALASTLIAGGAQASDRVTVFAAASLKTVLDRIIAEQGIRDIRLSYGGSSALARQIQFGAEADLFLSASPDWMEVLDSEGLLVPGSRVDLLSNRLVLIAPAGSTTGDLGALGPDSDLGAALEGGLLAMALVDAVPAGQYGKAALSTLGLWDNVAAQVVQADNVRAALRLVAIGEAALGIVYATDAVAEPRVRVIARIPDDSHPPIRYPMALIAGRDGAAARALYTVLTGPAARAQFDAEGFGRPAQP